MTRTGVKMIRSRSVAEVASLLGKDAIKHEINGL